MTSAELRKQINVRFPTYRAFCIAFSEASGVTLTEQALSRQLSGRVNLSVGWKAAYNLFLNHQNQNNMTLELTIQVQDRKESAVVTRETIDSEFKRIIGNDEPTWWAVYEMPTGTPVNKAGTRKQSIVDGGEDYPGKQYLENIFTTVYA